MGLETRLHDGSEGGEASVNRADLLSHLSSAFCGEPMDVALHTGAGKLTRVVEVALKNEFGFMRVGVLTSKAFYCPF